LQGYECPCGVLIANHIEGLHNNRFFSRIISDLILVFDEKQALELSLDLFNAQIIPVFGECFSLINYSEKNNLIQ